MDQSSVYQRETYRRQAEGPLAGGSPGRADGPQYEQEIAHIHANETASRVVAYTSPYLFWVAITLLCGGYLAVF